MGELITAQYKLNIHCKACARAVEEIFYQHEGVRKVEVDVGKGIVTVKGVKIDMAKIREVSERKCRRKIHLLTPIPEKKVEKIEVKKEVKKEVFSTVPITIYDRVPIGNSLGPMAIGPKVVPTGSLTVRSTLGFASALKYVRTNYKADPQFRTQAVPVPIEGIHITCINAQFEF